MLDAGRRRFFTSYPAALVAVHAATDAMTIAVSHIGRERSLILIVFILDLGQPSFMGVGHPSFGAPPERTQACRAEPGKILPVAKEVVEIDAGGREVRLSSPSKVFFP